MKEHQLPTLVKKSRFLCDPISLTLQIMKFSWTPLSIFPLFFNLWAQILFFAYWVSDKMSTFDTVNTDIEANGSSNSNANLARQRRRQRRRRRRRRMPSMAGSSETTTDGSFRFSDSDSDQSWHSPLGSVAGGSYRYEECGFSMRSEGNRVHSEHSKRGSCPLPDEEIDLESGELELKVHKDEKTCRICHLSLLKCGGIGDDDQLLEASGGMAIELGCSCKGDLAAAHKHCAETWFKIKGNT